MSAHRGTEWRDLLALPELVEARRRRRRVTTTLSVTAIALFSTFLIGFAFFPGQLGAVRPLGVPLSLWFVFSQFAGTWVLVWAYFRATRTYLQPAADAARIAVEGRRAGPSGHGADSPTTSVGRYEEAH